MKKSILDSKKLFIFDLDGTVTDTEPCHRESYDRTLKMLCDSSMGHEEFLENYVGHSETDIYRLMRKNKNIDFDDSEFFTTRVNNLFDIVKEKSLTTSAFYRQLEKLYPDRKFIALTSQRMSVLDRFREIIDYGKIKEFMSVAETPYGKKEVLADTEKYLGYKAEECVIFEDYKVTLRAAMDCGIFAVGVRHTLNSLGDDDCNAVVDIENEIFFE